jgi:hypothetical protein
LEALYSIPYDKALSLMFSNPEANIRFNNWIETGKDSFMDFNKAFKCFYRIKEEPCLENSHLSNLYTTAAKQPSSQENFA